MQQRAHSNVQQHRSTASTVHGTGTYKQHSLRAHTHTHAIRRAQHTPSAYYNPHDLAMQTPVRRTWPKLESSVKAKAPQTTQKKLFQYSLVWYRLLVTSMENSTPPMGAPNVLETPTAQAAASSCFLRARDWRTYEEIGPRPG